MTEIKKELTEVFADIIPKITETRREILAAYGEGLDAGLNIGLAMAYGGKDDCKKQAGA